MLRINNIRLSLGESNGDIKRKTAELLNVGENDIKEITLVKKAVDARKKNDVHYVCAVNISAVNEKRILLNCKNAVEVSEKAYSYPTYMNVSAHRPVVIGLGPAGLFAGLVLARNGFAPIVFERGSEVDKRRRDIMRFWDSAVLDENSNVQFGEGGAGTFSDGKLTTGIKDVRCRKVLEELVNFGAPNQIMYLAKPHIGTDNLRNIVKNIRNEIIRLGGEVHFDTKVTELKTENNRLYAVRAEHRGEVREIRADSAVLAIGHSARDTFEVLYKSGLLMESKPFSVGARIEHSQKMINKSQYGTFYKQLGAAEYKLSGHYPNGRSAYTFCMCPGGTVVGAASEKCAVVTNGMSCFARDGKNANSALLVGVNPSDFGTNSPLAGIEFQRRIERSAYKVGGENYNAPLQLVGDFLADRPSVRVGEVEPTYKPGFELSDLRECLPEFVADTMKIAIADMDKKLNGFAQYDAVLTGAETRSSSPVRILRDKTMQSSVKGIYPCGEGCGYAGGIMSAAVDGIKCAEALMKNNSETI